MRARHLSFVLLALVVACQQPQPNQTFPFRFIDSDPGVQIYWESPDGKNRSMGSGIVTRSGSSDYLWTAAHVIEGVEDNEIWAFKTICDLESDDPMKQVGWKVEIMAVDKELDLAILRFKERYPFSVAKFAIAIRPPPGTPVYVLGSPLGFEGLVTEGIVSRYVHLSGQPWFLLTNIVRPGTSGAGVFTFDGNCVGMVVMHNPSLDIARAIPAEVIVAWTKKLKLEHTLGR